MARIANKFIDRGYAGPYPPEDDSPGLTTGAGGELIYEWPMNHLEEDETGRRRNVENTANTGGNRLVMQQGDPEPLTLRLRGTILTKAQHDMMWKWWVWATNRTIEFHDFEGNEYEVQILSYLPTRVWVAGNPQDPVNAPNHKWTYSIEMQVVTVLAGDWDWGL